MDDNPTALARIVLCNLLPREHLPEASHGIQRYVQRARKEEGPRDLRWDSDGGRKTGGRIMFRSRVCRKRWRQDSPATPWGRPGIPGGIRASADWPRRSAFQAPSRLAIPSSSLCSLSLSPSSAVTPRSSIALSQDIASSMHKFMMRNSCLAY